MEMKDLKAKTPAALQEHLGDLHKEQFNLRMQRGTGQLTQTHQLRRVRREIARVKFLLGAKK
jgi:large subunit ribosomal protein L29